MTTQKSTQRDVQFMRRALTLAKRGLGRVEPNPLVGCVIASGDCFIAQGYHARFGGPHAEIAALAAAKWPVRSATMYVTLEPCCHQGKTPPCVDAIISAGIRRVVVAMKDPYPIVRGRGARRLGKAGVKVEVGLLESEARELNAPYLTLLKHRRPWIILKWAQGIDGRMSTPPGAPKQISGAAATRWVHRLRARVDGVLVGVGTVIADDPLLTARGVPLRRTASRIVVDTHLRTPVASRIVKSARQTPTLILSTRAAVRRNPAKSKRFERMGVEIQACKSRRGRVDLARAVALLGDRNMTNLLVEGGVTLHSQFLTNDLADEAFVIVAPRLIGGSSEPVTLDPRTVAHATIRNRRIGGDTVYNLQFRH